MGPRLTLDTNQNLQTGSATYGGNFIASSPVGWRDSYRIFRGGSHVGSIGTDSSGSKLQIFTGPTGDDAHARMTIDTAGRIGIGTPNPFGGALHVEGGPDTGVYATTMSTNSGYAVYGRNDNGIAVAGRNTSGSAIFGSSPFWAGFFEGNVYVTGTVTQNSDARLKQNITDLVYGLREVLALHPVTWNWKDKPDQGRQLGLIAQEVESALPELVATGKDAEQTKGINYIGMVPVTIKAIQEQQSQVDAQHKRIAEQQEQILQQQEQNRKLEERLAALEALLGKISSPPAVEQE